MPNWCCNLAHINCPNREIYDNLLVAINNNTWFKTFAPLSYHEEEKENDWTFDKANEIWNTKWPPQTLEIIYKDEDSLNMEISFETAWTPPNGVYKQMYNKFGIKTFAFYEEPGNEFFGKCCYSNEGEWNNEYDFPSNKNELHEIRKHIGEGSILDEFMSSTWENLEELWDLEDN